MLKWISRLGTVFYYSQIIFIMLYNIFTFNKHFYQLLSAKLMHKILECCQLVLEALLDFACYINYIDLRSVN